MNLLINSTSQTNKDAKNQFECFKFCLEDSTCDGVTKYSNATTSNCKLHRGRNSARLETTFPIGYEGRVFMSN